MLQKGSLILIAENYKLFKLVEDDQELPGSDLSASSPKKFKWLYGLCRRPLPNKFRFPQLTRKHLDRILIAAQLKDEGRGSHRFELWNHPSFKQRTFSTT
jgi:hypothetical protein